MKKHAAAFLMVAAALFLLPSCASTQECRKSAAGDLKIGWGKRSIAMPGPVPISGQFHLRVSQGTYTPVIASALVIENSKDAVIFVSCDVVSVQPKVLILAKEILAREIKGFPVEKLIINATHTHAGPSTGANVINYPNKMKVTPGSEVQKFIARQIADAVKEAWQKRAPGAVSYGYGFATTGHSRRAVYLRDMGKKFKASAGVAVNGHGIMYGNTADPDFASYEAGTDTFINLLYTFDSKGKLSGAVINVPCPSQTSEAVWSYNASFWHNVREKLAAKYGDVGVIAQSAAAGDLAPRQLHYKAAERRRYMLKYSKLIEEYVKNPMPRPAFNGVKSNAVAHDSGEVLELMRAEDIANRIVAAFDEVLSWAGKEKYSSPVLTHHVKTVKLAKRSFPKALVDDEKRKHAASMKEKFLTEGEELLVSLKGAGIANVSGVSVMSDSLILLWGGDADKVEVYAITPITQEEMQEREEIVIADIAGKGQSELVKAAAAAFSRTNENTKIVYESDKDAEAYRTRIMVDVMNGGGPDMLWVTREDMDLLQEKGALLELSKMLSEDIKEQIWPAVLELGTVEGQYVGIAPEVNIHAFMVSKEILQSPEWSWEKFLTVAQKIQPALTVSIGETLPKPEGSIRTLLFPNLENFGLVNMDERSCHFVSEEFKEFLKQCKKNLSMGKELDIAGMLQSGECLVSSQSITGIYQYDLIQSQFEESCEYVDNGYIDSEAFLVVNKKTTDTDTISAFVEHLLSMENQMNRVNDNRIREDAVRNSIEMWEMDDGTIMLLSASEGYGGAVLSIREDGSNRVEEYIAFLRNCKAYPHQNKVINRIIEEEVNAYFYGNRSVDAVTENIQNRVELYLEE